MNRRTRKKKRIREFDCKGFDLEFVFPRSISVEESDEFVIAFIEFVESIDLGVGGGGDDTQMSWFVTKHLPGRRKRNGRLWYKHVDCTSMDQDRVKTWLEDKVPGIITTMGPLVGSNSGK